MTIASTHIEPVKLIHAFRADDARGTFVKTFHYAELAQAGIPFQLRESFYSVSHKDVIRGMHFHHPPYDHEKIVFCTEGRILDVALDLRMASPTYGQCVAEELSFENNRCLYIPKGFAHGFLTLSENATTCYFVSGEYQREADDGVRYDSFGFNWGVAEPILSGRDLNFLPLNEFKSPF